MRIINLHNLNYIITFLIVGCTPPGQLTLDPKTTPRVAEEVTKYLQGCPDFFIPPVGGTNGTSTNKSGAVAWNPTFHTGPIPLNGFTSPDTKTRYITKINLASIPQQSNWNQYKTAIGSGFPGYKTTSAQIPESENQAGFVCFLLVWRAITDANLDPYQQAEPFKVDDLTSNLEEITDMLAVRKGDIVFYDFDNSIGNDGRYEHVGVIVDATGTDPFQWKIVSSIGIVENFMYGAKKTKLGSFRSTANGGDFTNWPHNMNIWQPKIFGIPHNK